jgi:hypothetical protein
MAVNSMSSAPSRLHTRGLTPSRTPPRLGVGGILVVSLLALACSSHGAERRLLDQFFSLSRLRDRTALQQIATVVFEPRQDGTVAAFTIVKVEDVEQSDAAVASKQVTVSAPVRLPDGQTVTKKIVLVLQRRDRWFVTGFTVWSG